MNTEDTAVLGHADGQVGAVWARPVDRGRWHEAAGGAGPFAERGVADHQVAGGQRERAQVDHGADPREHVVAGDGEAAADYDPGRVVEMDEAGDHLADPAGRLADQPDRRALAGPQHRYQLIEGGRELTAADIDRARQPGDQVGYRGYDALGREVSCPFGHGLSYTSFGYADLTAMVSGRADNGNPDFRRQATIDSRLPEAAISVGSGRVDD